MSITPLSAARIAGEVGLAGGTITGGACAAKYSSQLVVQGVKMEGNEDKITAANANWRKWAQYAVSCMNSINNKGTVSPNTKEAATAEALACKSHMESKLKDKVDIDWRHGAPGGTEAGKNL